MKILTIGRTGQLGTELARQCPAGWTMTALGRDEVDLADAATAAALVADADADIVINAASYTAVDKAESEEDLGSKRLIPKGHEHRDLYCGLCGDKG